MDGLKSGGTVLKGSISYQKVFRNMLGIMKKKKSKPKSLMKTILVFIGFLAISVLSIFVLYHLIHYELFILGLPIMMLCLALIGFIRIIWIKAKEIVNGKEEETKGT